MRRRTVILGLAGIVNFPETAGAVDRATPRRIRAASARLIAPCCFSQTVEHHSSPQAERMKLEIRDRLREGWTEDEIVEDYVARYGERILAAPRPVGFNRLAYMAPVLFIALGAITTALWIRRHQMDQAGLDEGSSSPHLSPRQRLVLREHLARLD